MVRRVMDSECLRFRSSAKSRERIEAGFHFANSRDIPLLGYSRGAQSTLGPRTGTKARAVSMSRTLTDWGDLVSDLRIEGQDPAAGLAGTWTEQRPFGWDLRSRKLRARQWFEVTPQPMLTFWCQVVGVGC